MIVYLDKYLNTILNCQIYFKQKDRSLIEDIQSLNNTKNMQLTFSNFH